MSNDLEKIMSNKELPTENQPLVPLADGTRPKPIKKPIKKPKRANKPKKPQIKDQPANIEPVAEPTPAPQPLLPDPAPAIPAVPTKPTLTPALQIWNDIKDRVLDIFGMKHQCVSDYCEFVPMRPDRCYLKFKVSATIPAVEAVSPEYNFEQIGKYIILSRKEKVK
jgi:hypothetical protein